MQHFSFEDGPFYGVKIVHPFIYEDERGNFIKDYSERIFTENHLEHGIKEIFYAKSKKNVIRGLHFVAPELQAKLIRVISGCIYDVIVDLRKDSPTFGQWAGLELSEENQCAILIPGGFAHGYLTLSEAMVSYLCDTNFDPACDCGILWNDKTLNISWPDVEGMIIVSEKDKMNMTFETFKKNFGGL